MTEKSRGLKFELAEHWPRVRTLMERYERMDLADACVVVMSEQHARCQVLTIDRRDSRIPSPRSTGDSVRRTAAEALSLYGDGDLLRNPSRLASRRARTGRGRVDR